jgi:hypothetical protein
MDTGSTESRDGLLAAYRDDLQRQLGRSAVIEDLCAREGFGVVIVAATVRAAAHRFELLGTGENIVTAYADLLRSSPEPILSSAFRQLVDV